MNKNSGLRIGLRSFSLLLVFAAIIYQISLVMKKVPNFSWTGLQGSATYRSARSLEGQDFAEYIEFLRSEIPTEGEVMLPPRVLLSPVAHMGLMQFLLFPRELHNCGPNEVEACLNRVNDSETFYIVAIWDFPPEDMVNPKRQLIGFTEDLGLYPPPP